MSRYFTLDCRDGQHRACDTCSCACHVALDQYPQLSSVPQAEAAARTSGVLHTSATPNAPTVAAPHPHGAATPHTLRPAEALAATAIGIVVALAGTVPAAAATIDTATRVADGAAVALVLLAVAGILTAATLSGRARRPARPGVEARCCLVEHSLAGDDEADDAARREGIR